ncbi:MAG: hypothetical protein DMG30_12965 [Acidobacteria bacterium]|nr:MAG: hypothetical protein DMG30_12965 [Acidobacteriota bacterium]
MALFSLFGNDNRAITRKLRLGPGLNGMGAFGLESAAAEEPTLMKPFFLLLLLFLVVPTRSASAQSKADLVGIWKLVSATETTKKGEARAVYGWKNPQGLITYTADGRMMAITTNGGREPLSVPDNVGAPAEERAEAFATMTAYAGRYTLDGNEVIHHIEVCSIPNAVNTDQVRLITNLKGNSLTLRTATILGAYAQIAYREFVWERISK